jgi:hypothetical protein
MFDVIYRFFATLLRLAFTLAGIALAGVMLLFGLAVAVALIGWSVLSGRRPALRFAKFQAPHTRWQPPSHGMSPRGKALDVIDVDARVVPDSAKRVSGD